MGEVYRARDTRLGREVALKVLAETLSDNGEFRQRFEREARTISQLQHPHICTLFDVGSESGIDFLVMEYLEGETLEERLGKGALAIAQVLEIGSQIAAAIDAAHKAEVVHRDLKPGNVMLTKTGVKVLDFGLAKSIAAEPLPVNTQSPTIMQPITGQGAVIGTPLYMAPEQLEGKDTDARTDIWALGCVLYEMTTGRRAFEGDSSASVIGAVLHVDPAALCEVRTEAPSELEALVRRCLVKQADGRESSAAQILQELKSISATSPGGALGSDGESRPSIAVLPFVNLSSEAAEGYFADGLAADVITRLSERRSFPVVSRNASFAYRGERVDFERVGRELGVRYVVEGSVRKAGNRVRVSADLVETTTGREVWAARYDHELSDIFRLQDEISEAIASAVPPEVWRFERERALRHKPEELGAWDTAQRAWGHLNRFRREENRKARSLFARAVELAPQLISALYGLAMTHYIDAMNQWTDQRDGSLETARELAERCTAVDEKDPLGHIAFGCVYSLTGPLEKAISAVELAVQLDPDSTWARVQLATFLAQNSKAAEAAEQLSSVRSPELVNPLRWSYLYATAITAFSAGRYEETVEASRVCLQLRPHWLVVHSLLASSLGHLNRKAEALESLEAMRELDRSKGWSTASSDFSDRVKEGLVRARPGK